MRHLAVHVYRNLHNGGFSVRDRSSGLVAAHADAVLVEAAVFRVSEAGRRRVLTSGVRNVHAGVDGNLVIDPVRAAELMARPRRPVSYNPFRGPAFTDPDGREVWAADSVLFRDGRCWV